MNKISIALIINVILLLTGFNKSAFSQAEILRFIQVANTNQWQDVLLKAQKSDQLVFVDLFSNGCLSCTETDNTTFKNSKLIAYFNEHFINVKVDIDSEFGIKLIEGIKITNIPAFYFSDAAGHRISEILEGGRSADALLDRADYYFEAYNGMQELKTKYYSNSRDDMVLLDYVYSLVNLKYNVEGKLIADQYFKTNKVFTYSPQEWRLIRTFLSDVRDVNVKRLMKEDSIFASIYGKSEVNKYLSDIFRYNYSASLANKDTSLLEASLEVLDHIDISSLDLGVMPLAQVKDYFRISYLENNLNWNAYSNKVSDFMTKYEVAASDQRDFIIKFCQNVNSNEMIVLANGWAKSLVKKKKSYENYICFALTQDRLGEKENALKMLDKAGKFAKNENERIMLVELNQQITGSK